MNARTSDYIYVVSSPLSRRTVVQGEGPASLQREVRLRTVSRRAQRSSSRYSIAVQQREAVLAPESTAPDQVSRGAVTCQPHSPTLSTSRSRKTPDPSPIAHSNNELMTAAIISRTQTTQRPSAEDSACRHLLPPNMMLVLLSPFSRCEERSGLCKEECPTINYFERHFKICLHLLLPRTYNL